MMENQDNTFARRLLDDTLPGRVCVLDGAFGITSARIDREKALNTQKILNSYLRGVQTVLSLIDRKFAYDPLVSPPKSILANLEAVVQILREATALDSQQTEYFFVMVEILSGLEMFCANFNTLPEDHVISIGVNSRRMMDLSGLLKKATVAFESLRPVQMYKPGLEFKQTPEGLAIPAHFVPGAQENPPALPKGRIAGAEMRGGIFFETIRPRLQGDEGLAASFDLSHLDYLNTSSVGSHVATARLNLGGFPSHFRFPEGEGPIGDVLANLSFYRKAALAAVEALLADAAFVQGLEARFTSDFKDRGFSKLDPHNAEKGHINVSRRGMWGASRYDPNTEATSARSSQDWRLAYLRNDAQGTRRLFVQDFCFRTPSTEVWHLSSIQSPLTADLEHCRAEGNEMWAVLGEFTGMKLGSLGARFLRKNDQLILEMVASHYPASTLRAAGQVMSSREAKFFEPSLLPSYLQRGDLTPSGFPSRTSPREPFTVPMGIQPQYPEQALAALIEGVPPVHRQFGLPVNYRVLQDLHRYHPEVNSRVAVTF